MPLRSNINPTTGSMFAIRSSGQACRLWVGQNITTPGDNKFYASYTGTSGNEHDTSLYKHSLTDNEVTFGTPVICQYDLTCGDLTANALYGSAAVQIQNNIDNSIAAATSYARFSAYASVASATFTTGSQVVPYDTIVHETGSDFILAGNVLTVNKSMVALVCYNVSVDALGADESGSARTNLRIELKKTNNLGIPFSAVNGTATYTYNRSGPNGEATGSMSMILPLSSGDHIIVEIVKEEPNSSTMQTIANACSISIMEV